MTIFQGAETTSRFAPVFQRFWQVMLRYAGFKVSDGLFRLLSGIVMSAAILSVGSAGPAAASDQPLRIAAFGDSLTAGYGLPAAAAFPVQLQRALAAKGRKVIIENAGVSGDTTQAGLDRLDWSIADGVDGVIVELGANDALRGLDPEQTRAALEGIILRLKERKISVMLAGMRAPPNLGQQYTSRFDRIFADLAEKHGLVLYPFFLDGVAADRALNQPDGIHPTAEGVGVIVGRILPTVEKFLDSIRPSG